MTIMHNVKECKKPIQPDSGMISAHFDYENLMNLAGVAIAVIDLKTFEVVEYNDAVCKILGCTRQQCEEIYHHNLKTSLPRNIKEN